nr:MAG TPA: hypothetical protein [Caudoviricetes sp.]
MDFKQTAGPAFLLQFYVLSFRRQTRTADVKERIFFYTREVQKWHTHYNRSMKR